MGPYLAQPVLDKMTFNAENAKLKLKFARCEMQGKSTFEYRLEKKYGRCSNRRIRYWIREFNFWSI